MLEPTAIGGYGGTETRAWAICRGLAKIAGADVSLVVRNRSLGEPRTIDGVTVVPKKEFLYWSQHTAVNSLTFTSAFPFIRIKSWNWRLPFQFSILVAVQLFRRLRGRIPRPHSVYTALDSDLYFAFGVHSESACVIASAKSIGRKTVLFLGADTDIDERFQPNSKYRTPYGEYGSVCHYALTEADVIVAQTEVQRKRLRDVFGLDCFVMANPIDCDFWANPGPNVWSQKPLSGVPFEEYVLWVGRADTFHKRPMLMLEIARELPDVPFLMVMNPRDDEVERAVESARPGNVHVIRAATYHQMPSLFQRARVFVSTSAAQYEGFPNTFLQAAATDTPIVSLEICEAFLNDSSAGVFASSDISKAKDAIEQSWKSRCDEREESRETAEYLRAHHDVKTPTQQLFERITESIR